MEDNQSSLEGLTVITLVDGFVDMFAPSAGPLTRVAPGQTGKPLMGGHGSSYLVDCRHPSGNFTFMIDGGMTGAMVRNNLEALGRGASQVQAMVLTHGHPDHYNGLAALAPEVTAGAPFYAHPEAFLPRKIRTPRGEAGPWSLDRGALEAAGMEVVEVVDRREIGPGVALSGQLPEDEVPPARMPGHLVVREGRDDPEEAADELAVVFDRGERGLIVLTACAHRRATAVVSYVAGRWGKRVAGLIAGFHLSQAPAEEIDSLAGELDGLDLDFVLSGHCTGFPANAVFSRVLGERFLVNTVGSRLEW